MRISWRIYAADVRRVSDFLRRQDGEPLVKKRRARNLVPRKKPVSKAEFWRALIMGLVTTQQPSGPGGKVSIFLRSSPFPLTYRRCKAQDDLSSYAEAELQKASLRFSTRLGEMVATNLQRMEDGLWTRTRYVLETARRARTQQAERQAAEFIRSEYKGFGPKQSRNILQKLGLSRFEIPLDSRVAKWLNEFGFPVKLSARGLADPHYYDFVSDGVQALCEKADVFPCILDAAIFSSFDRASGTQDRG